MDIGNKKGGRGQCDKCGEWYDNVSFHTCNPFQVWWYKTVTPNMTTKEVALAAWEHYQKEAEEYTKLYAQSIAALLDDKPLNGEYVHHVWCNAGRQKPVGNDMCSCGIGRRIKKLLYGLKKCKIALYLWNGNVGTMGHLYQLQAAKKIVDELVPDSYDDLVKQEKFIESLNLNADVEDLRFGNGIRNHELAPAEPFELAPNRLIGESSWW